MSGFAQVPPGEPAYNLLPNPAVNKIVLSGAPVSGCLLRTGTSSWMHYTLQTSVYPAGTALSGQLSSYSQHFDTVDLELTYYRDYKESDIRQIMAQVQNPDFAFLPNLHKKLIQHWIFDEADIDEANRFDSFEDMKGPVLIKIPQRYSVATSAALYKACNRIKNPGGYVIDFLHQSWLGPKNYAEVYAQMQNAGIGLVIRDLAGHTPPNTQLASPISVVKFYPVTDEMQNISRLRAWAHLLQQWKLEGLRDSYFIIMPSDKLPQHLQFMQQLLAEAGSPG